MEHLGPTPEEREKEIYREALEHIYYLGLDYKSMGTIKEMMDTAMDAIFHYRTPTYTEDGMVYNSFNEEVGYVKGNGKIVRYKDKNTDLIY